MKGQTNKFILKERLQRVLRRNMTDAEQALWKKLRNCQIKGYKFRRQHPFGDFILDFVCLEARLVIEIDGGQHSESDRDLMRDRALEEAGFSVMRFWNNQVLNEIKSVMEAIWLQLQPHPHPNPPLEGEGMNAKSEKLQTHHNPPLEEGGAGVSHKHLERHDAKYPSTFKGEGGRGMGASIKDGGNNHD